MGKYPVNVNRITYKGETKVITRLALEEWIETPHYEKLCSNIKRYPDPEEMTALYRESLQEGLLTEESPTLQI